MPHKRNPVASVVILGCVRRAPGLLATLAAAAEQEHQRAAGAWHAEWETLSDLLRLTGSAASWSADLLAGLRVDADRMRANLDASGGLPLAEHVTAVLTPVLGRLAAHDLLAAASARTTQRGVGLVDALLSDSVAAAALSEVSIGRAELDAAVDPAQYLGASAGFVQRALAAHYDRARWHPTFHGSGGHETGKSPAESDVRSEMSSTDAAQHPSQRSSPRPDQRKDGRRE